MGRKTKDYDLRSKTARAKLPARGNANKPFWHHINSTLALGWRRDPEGGPGAWVSRLTNADGTYSQQQLGESDDDGAGHLALSYDGALAAAAQAFSAPAVSEAGPITVWDACARYCDHGLETGGEAMKKTLTLNLPKRLCARPIADLKLKELEDWRRYCSEKLQARKRAAIAAGSHKPEGDDEVERTSRASTNRILTALKAALNGAFRDRDNHLENDSAWRHGLKKYSSVDAARPHHFSEEQVLRWIAAAAGDPAFQNLLRGGWLTGARIGELRLPRVRDFSAEGATLYIPNGKGAKTGARTMILLPESVALIEVLCEGKDQGDLIFTRGDGEAWGDTDQQARVKATLAAAGLDEEATFYALRHSYVSRAIEHGVDWEFLAKNLGTSVRMLKQNYAHVTSAIERANLMKFRPQAHAIEASEQDQAVLESAPV